MKITSGCRCCGEVEHLELLEDYAEEWVFAEDGSVKRSKTGAYAIEATHVVRCPICGTEAPLETWNGPSGMFSDFWRIRRAATLAAWKQHELAVAIVVDHLRANTGDTYGLLDPWPALIVEPAEVLFDIEKAGGLPSSGDQPGSIEGIVNSLAGRIPEQVMA